MSYTEIVDYWFNNKSKWFAAEEHDDKYISEYYGHLIDQDLITSEVLSCSLDVLALIIVYDQFPRHIYRRSIEQAHDPWYHEKALMLSLWALENGFDYTAEQRCFVLMPFRHDFSVSHISFSIKKIKEYMLEDKPNLAVYQRFYRAALTSLAKIINGNLEFAVPDYSITERQISSTLDPLHLLPCEANSNLVAKMRQFLIENLPPESKLVVSLSGGVDSMVCCYILAALRKHNLVAAHIDYANRPETRYESEMVVRWCERLSVPVMVRRIDEIKRTRDHDRNLYEEFTKKVRFDVYKKLGNVVVLGHNRDDSIENIFSNIKKRKNYENLLGMAPVRKHEGIVLLRPFLDVPKSKIIEFAQRNKIPFVRDSTPKWCERGKMRDHLVPFINNFDKDIIPGLLSVSQAMQTFHSIVDHEISAYIKTFIKKGDIWAIVVRKDQLDYGLFYWQRVITKFCLKQGIKIPSVKSIENFEERLGKLRGLKQCTVNLHKNLSVVLQL